MTYELVFFLKEDLDAKQCVLMCVIYTATEGLKQGHRSRQTAASASFIHLCNFCLEESENTQVLLTASA